MQSASRPCLTSHSYWRETLRRLLITTLTKRTNTRDGEVRFHNYGIPLSIRQVHWTRVRWIGVTGNGRYPNMFVLEIAVENRVSAPPYRGLISFSPSPSSHLSNPSLVLFHLRHLSNVCQRSIYFFSSQERTS